MKWKRSWGLKAMCSRKESQLRAQSVSLEARTTVVYRTWLLHVDVNTTTHQPQPATRTHRYGHAVTP